MGQAARKTAGGVTMTESLHAGDCAVAAELMDALAVCAMDQLKSVQDLIREDGRAVWIANVETFDVVTVLMETVRTQARVIQDASEAIQHLQHATYRERVADRGGEAAA